MIIISRGHNCSDFLLVKTKKENFRDSWSSSALSFKFSHCGLSPKLGKVSVSSSDGNYSNSIQMSALSVYVDKPVPVMYFKVRFITDINHRVF